MDVQAPERPVGLPPVKWLAQCLNPGFYTALSFSFPTFNAACKNLASYDPRLQLRGLRRACYDQLMLGLSRPQHLEL